MRYLPYNNKLKYLAREHRNNSTYAEVLLWLELRNRQLRGYRFNRQKPLGNYIADFYCAKLKLVIEVDGITHIQGDQEEQDRKKDKYYRSKKLQVIRLDDETVRKNISAALDEIESYIDEFEQNQQDK